MTTNPQELGVLGDESDEVSRAPVVGGDFGALAAVSRAEVDMQVTTARQYPRSIAKFQKEAYELATLDQQTAESMFYSLPRKERGKTKFVEGPSVRFAEVIAYAWGNLRFEGRVVEIGREFVTAQGTAWDLERNLGSRIEVKRRITNRSGVRFADDMIAVTGNAAVSIALRNAIFDVVPFALAKKVYEAAVRTASGENKPMDERRKSVVESFRALGAAEDVVYELLGVRGSADITSDHIRHLVGLRNMIANGDTTLEAVLREVRGTATATEGSGELNAALKTPAPTQPAAQAAPTPAEKPKATAAALRKLRELREGVQQRTEAGLLRDDYDGIELAIAEKDGEAVSRWIADLEERLAVADGKLKL